MQNDLPLGRSHTLTVGNEQSSKAYFPTAQTSGATKFILTPQMGSLHLQFNNAVQMRCSQVTVLDWSNDCKITGSSRQNPYLACNSTYITYYYYYYYYYLQIHNH